MKPNQQKTETKPNPFAGKKWITKGLIFGAIMFVIVTLIVPYLSGKQMTKNEILFELMFWCIGGLAMGYILKLLRAKKKIENNDTM